MPRPAPYWKKRCRSARRCWERTIRFTRRLLIAWHFCATHKVISAPLELYIRSLAIRQKALGPARVDEAITLNNLGNLLFELGDYDTSRLRFEQALKILMETAGPTTPLYAQSLNNLAAVRESVGDYAGARVLLEKALAIRKEALGNQHPSYAQSLTALASLFFEQGDYLAARPLLDQALAIDRRAYGQQHPETARVTAPSLGCSKPKGTMSRRSLSLSKPCDREGSVG